MLNKLIRLVLVLAVVSFMCFSTHATSVQPFIGVSTFAGSFSNGDGLLASETKVESAYAITVNSKTGDFYMGDNRRVRKINAITNIMTTIAGKSNNIDPGDGQPAVNTPLSYPKGLDFSPSGELYICDYLTCKIKKISPEGIMTTIAGTGPGKNNARSVSGGFIGDGALANETQLEYPDTIVFHPISGELYISESNGYKIRKINKDNRVETVVGTGVSGFSGDGGLAKDAKIGTPSNFIFDSMGNMYLSDRTYNRVRKVLTNGTIITIAGNGVYDYNGDGVLATDTYISRPSGLAISSTGELYIAESYGHRIRKVLANGTITTFAGKGVSGYAGDGGLAVNALLNSPESIYLTSDYLYISDYANYRIRRVSLADGIISTIAGGGLGDGKSATVYGVLKYPRDITKGLNGNFFIADTGNSRIRKVSSGGIISTIAPITTNTSLNSPLAIVTNNNGDIFFADSNYKIYKISNQDGSISTIIGNGVSDFSEDGSVAEGSPVGELSGIAINSLGEVIFSDKHYHRIRKILTNGTLVTISGLGNNNYIGYGFTGDGGPAQFASLYYPGRLFIKSDDIYFADQANLRIRKIFSNGTITTIAGIGNGEYGMDGILATETDFESIGGIVVNSKDEIIVADGSRIRKIGTDGIIVTIAGKGTDYILPFGDGGPAISATFRQIAGLYIDSNDDIYLSDPDNLRIRKISMMCPTYFSLNGTECIPTCNGVFFSDVSVCSARGSCNANNTCVCSSPYFGGNCEFFNCSGISNNSTQVCSSHGVCASPEVCNCESGYQGTNCEIYKCFEIYYQNSSVCSSQGTCVAPNNCSCKSGYYGNNCEMFKCFDVNYQNSTVCSSQGNCVDPNNCTCKSGYYGNNCEMFKCFDVNYQNLTVCSSQGNCTSPNMCSCKIGYSGSNCESFTCKGIKNNDSSVCSSRGNCILPDTCKCTTVNSYGPNCEFIVEVKTSNITAAKSVRLNDGSSLKNMFIAIWIMLISIFIL